MNDHGPVTDLGRLVRITGGRVLTMVVSPAQKLLRQGMGVRKAPTLQQEITPLTPPAGNAVQECQEDRIMGGFILHYHSGPRCQATG